ncbi:retrovirus-related pol polyprotein from transposon TNT 1-94 [Tanacetum coccineum]
MEEVSLTIDEAKLKKMADEMLRQRCTSGDEHQYHINQMNNFLQSDIVWESRKEIIVSPHPQKTTPLVQSCPIEIPKLSTPNKSRPLYLKKGMIWERVHDFQLGIESYQQKVNLAAPTMSFLGSTRRIKSFNNDVKYGYIQRDLTNDEVEYLTLFEEEIEVSQSNEKMGDRENQKWLNKALDEGPYQFEMFIPNNSIVPKLQTAEDLQGDALLHYDAEMELMNLILLSIPNDIYNSVDACTSAKDIFEKLVNVSRAKKLEKSHDPLALVAHTGSSSRNTSSYYVTHPTSVVDYEDEYQQDDVHTNSEDPLASAMLLLARAITQNFSTLTNNRLRTSSNTRNQAIIQGDRVNIQSRNSGNAGRNNRRAYVQEEIVEGSNAPNETGNVQRTLRTSSSGNTSTVQCYNCSGKGHYARNCPKPRVRDSKYFMEQMLLAKQDEAGVILTDEQNDFLFADASRMEEIEELSANICLMARIQPADNTSDVGPSYDSAFISEVQSSSNNENEEQMYPTHTKIINSAIGDNQIDSDIIFDSPNGNVNSSSIEKDTHVPDLWYLNPYTLKQAISQCLSYYLPNCLGNSEISLKVRDNEDTLDDASKSQQKRGLKEMQDCFESTESELCELEKQNDFLKDQLLEVSLKHEVELSVLLNHECVDNSLHAKIEQLKKKSIKIQEGLQVRITILEKDVQRCEKQSVDFELKLQHEKEKHKWDLLLKNKNTNPLDYSWISKMKKLEDENMSLDFTVQSLIKECDDVKLEYQKLFNSIKKTWSQTQTEIDELKLLMSLRKHMHMVLFVLRIKIFCLPYQN